MDWLESLSPHWLWLTLGLASPWRRHRAPPAGHRVRILQHAIEPLAPLMTPAVLNVRPPGSVPLVIE